MDLQDLPLKAFVLNRCFAAFATLLVVVLFATLRTDTSPHSRPYSSSSFCYALNRYPAAFTTLLVVILLLRSEQMLRRIRDLARRRPFCYARFRSWLRALFAKANCREKLLAVQQPIRRLAYI